MAKSFTYLDEMIKSGNEEIILDDDIILMPEEEEKYRNGIDVDEEFIVIDGNGHTIDARSKSRIFNINGGICYLFDLNLENGFSNEDGGAIIVRGDDVILDVASCTFSKSSAKNGGAILAYRRVRLKRCRFTANKSEEAGSAIAVSAKTDIDVESCEFMDNASRFGGAIANAGRLKVSNSTFEKNTSRDCGAAISSIFSFPPCCSDDYGKSTSLKVAYSTFKGNSARDNGGAIDSSSPTEIMECYFMDNNASANGGALKAHGKVDLNGCIFKNNSAGDYGGAVHNSWELNITGCIFSGNASHKCGGALSNKNKLNISSSRFVSNRADNGGAIFNLKFLNISDSTFIENSSKIGGVLHNAGYIDIEDSNFCRNLAEERGGVIFNTEKVKIDHSLFAENRSLKTASAICNSYWLEMFNSRFEGNCAPDSAEPIINGENTVFVRKDYVIERCPPE